MDMETNEVKSEKEKLLGKRWKPTYLDFSLSPYTGLTRESWIDAAKYLLRGIFQNIESIDDPVVLPRQDTAVTYPHLLAPEDQQERERKAEIFEGLTRSFFIASVLIENEPAVEIEGKGLRDYYSRQILRVTDPTDALYVGSYQEMLDIAEKQEGYRDPCHTFQQTVETCALVIGLYASEKEIWERYSKAEQDQIAAFLSEWARESTVPQNWRLFNMLDMAFLKMHGYKVDDTIMLEHAAAILNYYAGDGWYRDGQSFDYYSVWAFNFYGPLWCQWYGYQYAPALAARFEENSNALMKTFPDMFDRDGFTNMWGRSCIYRNASTSAFDGNFFLRHAEADPGRARRIASGSLLQFLTRDDFLYEGAPTLGFYRQFMPLVQSYSCAESPLWLGKAFLCLHLPKEHPFWTAKENNGDWGRLSACSKGEQLVNSNKTATDEKNKKSLKDECKETEEKSKSVHEEKKTIKETYLSGPALDFTNHGRNGETILRTAKVVKAHTDREGMWNYGKLCYNTKYPWEAAPAEDIEAQQYVLIQETKEGRMISYPNAIYLHGHKDGVLYRRGFFNYRLDAETHWIDAVNLADFPVDYGIFRVDQMRILLRPCVLRLGSYGFPDHGQTAGVNDEQDQKKLIKAYVINLANKETIQKKIRRAHAIILTGRDHMGHEKQMAMTIYSGFDTLRVIDSIGTNPDSERSKLILAEGQFCKHYDASEQHLYISQVITKESAEPFTEDELFPVKSINYSDPYGTGITGEISIQFKNGKERHICFDIMENNLCM